MRRCWQLILACVAVFIALAGAAGTGKFHDPETGLVFSEYVVQYDLGRTLVVRVAVPTDVSSSAAYDAVLQVIAPSNAGWVGVAWGGRMIGDPLAVAWQSGSSVILSSRRASDHAASPGVFSGATYSVFRKATHSNGTHWQYTARCSGCTSYANSGGTKTWVYPTGVNHLAFAYASSRPLNPSSSSSTLQVHDNTGNWDHDFSQGQNPTFASLVAKNLAR